MDMDAIGLKLNGTKSLFRYSCNNCAYIYTDGIVLKTEVRSKKGKQNFVNEVVHIFPAQIQVTLYGKTHYEHFTGRLVCRNTTLLLDGLQRVSIYFRNTSKAMDDQGITCNTVTLITQSGMEIRENILPFLSGDFTIQNDEKLSIKDWQGDYSKNVVTHE